MFNKSYRNSSINRLETAQKNYTDRYNYMGSEANLLYKSRKELQEHIESSIDYINTIKNKPMELDTKVEEIKFETSRFSELEKLMYDKAKEVDFKSKSSAGAGIAAGAGVAAFGPSAAMGIAMTFGTASTGTAISALSGAAATNAALAWLGGGALAASGGGMVAGNALLALAGPVGWAIGGVSLVGAGLISNSKNKKIAAEALSKAIDVEVETKIINGLRAEIKEIRKTVAKSKKIMLSLITDCKKNGNNYAIMSENQRYKLGTLVNNTLSTSQLLNRGIGENK